MDEQLRSFLLSCSYRRLQVDGYRLDASVRFRERDLRHSERCRCRAGAEVEIVGLTCRSRIGGALRCKLRAIGELDSHRDLGAFVENGARATGIPDDVVLRLVPHGG